MKQYLLILLVVSLCIFAQGDVISEQEKVSEVNADIEKPSSTSSYETQPDGNIPIPDVSAKPADTQPQNASNISQDPFLIPTTTQPDGNVPLPDVSTSESHNTVTETARKETISDVAEPATTPNTPAAVAREKGPKTIAVAEENEGEQEHGNSGGHGSSGHSGNRGPDTRPPGWDKGEKTGWGDGDIPPGLRTPPGRSGRGRGSNK